MIYFYYEDGYWNIDYGDEDIDGLFIEYEDAVEYFWLTTHM